MRILNGAHPTTSDFVCLISSRPFVGFCVWFCVTKFMMSLAHFWGIFGRWDLCVVGLIGGKVT